MLFPRKLVAQVTDQMTIEWKPAHDFVRRAANPGCGQPAHQLRHHQKLDALGEVKPWNLLLEVMRIVDSPE